MTYRSHHVETWIFCFTGLEYLGSLTLNYVLLIITFLDIQMVMQQNSTIILRLFTFC